MSKGTWKIIWKTWADGDTMSELLYNVTEAEAREYARHNCTGNEDYFLLEA